MKVNPALSGWLISLPKYSHILHCRDFTKGNLLLSQQIIKFVTLLFNSAETVDSGLVAKQFSVTKPQNPKFPLVPSSLTSYQIMDEFCEGLSHVRCVCWSCSPFHSPLNCPVLLHPSLLFWRENRRFVIIGSTQLWISPSRFILPAALTTLAI